MGEGGHCKTEPLESSPGLVEVWSWEGQEWMWPGVEGKSSYTVNILICLLNGKSMCDQINLFSNCIVIY